LRCAFWDGLSMVCCSSPLFLLPCKQSSFNAPF
jgi:hypothetical protein